MHISASIPPALRDEAIQRLRTVAHQRANTDLTDRLASLQSMIQSAMLDRYGWRLRVLQDDRMALTIGRAVIPLEPSRLNSESQF